MILNKFFWTDMKIETVDDRLWNITALLSDKITCGKHESLNGEWDIAKYCSTLSDNITCGQYPVMLSQGISRYNFDLVCLEQTWVQVC